MGSLKLQPTVFASLFAYAAQKHAGEHWPEVLRGYREDPLSSPWAGFETLAHAEAMTGENVLSYVDGSTLIAKARSRAAGLFLSCNADVWLQLDDDMLCDRAGLAKLVENARRLRGVAVAPYLLRDGTRVDIEPLDVQSTFASHVVPLRRFGLGCAAIHVDAVLAVSELVPYCTEPPGFPAAFIESIDDGGRWLADDYGFASRCERAGVVCVAVPGVRTVHAGRTYELGH